MNSPKTGTGSQGIHPSLVVVGRLALLAIAVVAVAAAFELSRGRDRAGGSFEAWVCPMHSEVTARGPGECPVCHMALERVSVAERDASSSDALIATATRRTFARAVRAPAWVDAGGRVVALLYQEDLMGLAPEEPGRFFRAAAAPSEGVDVRRTGALPAPWDASTSRLVFRRAPGAPVLDPGDVGWVELAPRANHLLAVPTSAVLVSPHGPYVLVPAPDGRSFTRRPLAIGQVLAGHAVVVSGLREGERVVVGNSFFLDAELRLAERPHLSEVTQ